MKKVFESLKFQTGVIKLKGDLATANLPDTLCYLDPQDTVTFLTKIWGNPPQTEQPLGMVFPVSNKTWGVVITYSEDGHVKDSDADKIDYTDLLKKMQEGMKQDNEDRKKQGYPPINLIGWAVPPHYDKQSNTLYWAKELRFGDGTDQTLNYNLRVLGRKGVLVLNAVAGMDQLAEVQASTPQLLQAVTFNAGNRYADFNDSTDKVATYGLAALVAGGVAAKLGLFKLLWVGLLASWKFIVIGVAAIGSRFKAFFGRFFEKKKAQIGAPPEEPPKLS